MCLAVPGRVESIRGDEPLQRTGKVNFDGVVRDVNLAFLPDVKPGDYVIVHVGMALSKVDPAEAQQIIEDIRLINQMSQEDQ
ncbi:MAG: HypC/HybG/HupF family hydrogenase formation chaperone [Candidatus Omnitrophica bacterium]|nr:HypC/HybG/HupF family hydrogenase formation chaperone [Candidatus Omnitrophota bacterium]